MRVGQTVPDALGSGPQQRHKVSAATAGTMTRVRTSQCPSGYGLSERPADWSAPSPRPPQPKALAELRSAASTTSGNFWEMMQYFKIKSIKIFKHVSTEQRVSL